VEITQNMLAFIFTGTAVATLLIIIVFGRWPKKKEHHEEI
jgi:hypothetical protein